MGVLAQSLTDPTTTDNFFDRLPVWSKYGILAVVLLAAVIMIESIRRNGSRDREVRSAALAAGLEYSETDNAAIGDLRFAAFAHGKGTTVSNMVTDRRGTAVVRAFDFASFSEYTTNERAREEEFVDTLWGVDGWGGPAYGSQSKKKVYSKTFSAACVKLAAFLPPLTVMPATILTRAFEKIGVEDIDFESEEFNKNYDVRCADLRFASLFLDASMINFILDLGPHKAFETFGNYVVCYGRELPPKELVALAATMSQLVPLVNSLVYDEYPAVAGLEYRRAIGDWAARPNGASGNY